MPEDNYNSNYGQGYNNSAENDSNFLREMVGVEDTMQKFEMETLRRKRLVIDIKNKTKNWEPMAKDVKPICNELGICEILGFLRGRGTIIARTTKKTDEEIMKDMHQFHRALIELFTLRADDWEINEELVKPLLEACVSLTQDIVFSARGGFASMNVRSSYGYSENKNMQSSGESEVKTILGMKINK